MRYMGRQSCLNSYDMTTAQKARMLWATNPQGQGERGKADVTVISLKGKRLLNLSVAGKLSILSLF